jgi:hypothetical protein
MILPFKSVLNPGTPTWNGCGYHPGILDTH